MRCSSCKPLLDRYSEGTLSTAEVLRIAAHLESCAECSAVFEELKVVDGLLTTLTPAQGPAANFTFAVMAEARSMPLPVAPRTNVLALSGAYILVAWAIIAVWLQVAGIGFSGALLALAGFAANAAGVAHSVTAGLTGVFGSGTPQVTAFVFTVLALDVAIGLGIALIYFVIRPRLAARLASARESS